MNNPFKVELMLPKDRGEYLMNYLIVRGIPVNHKFYTDNTVFIEFELLSSFDILSVFHAGINFKNRLINDTTL